jgi:isoleucyl-tRNA synthetase
MIEKNYQPADIESRMSRIWEESGAFKAGRPDRQDAAPFTIVIPPPNVTGSLHMGHALNNTLQGAASSACAVATCCGSPAPTMPASRPRWWSNGS